MEQPFGLYWYDSLGIVEVLQGLRTAKAERKLIGHRVWRDCHTESTTLLEYLFQGNVQVFCI